MFHCFSHPVVSFPLKDTVIYERLVEEQLYGDITLQHLEGFASYGRRVM